MIVKVKALRNVLGLRAGEVAEIEATQKVETLIRTGYLRWLDRPVEPAVEDPRPPRSARRKRVRRAETEDAFVLPEIQSASFEDDLGRVFEPDGEFLAALTEAMIEPTDEDG